MNIRPDVAELLHAGLTNREIARQLHTDEKKVSAARTALGIPRIPGGRRPASSPEDLFWRRTQPTDDGHLLWTGSLNSTGVPRINHGRKTYSAYRIAFHLANNRDPEGYAMPSCGRDACVKPGHQADRADRVREQRVDTLYAAIFGRPS